jgi:hypothetical protein
LDLHAHPDAHRISIECPSPPVTTVTEPATCVLVTSQDYGAGYMHGYHYRNNESITGTSEATSVETLYVNHAW